MDVQHPSSAGLTPGATEPRWVGVGHSSDADGVRAGRDAARQAASRRTPGLVLLFCSESYSLPELVAAVADEVGDVPLVGCSTAGEIATSGPAATSVVVVAMGGEGFSFSTAAATGASRRLREAGEEVARSVEGLDGGPNRALLVLTDGLAGDQQEVVRGIYGVVGASIPLVGGCAGDDLKMKRTYQFNGRQVLQDAVVAAAIASTAPMGIGVRHGWRKVGEALLVTRSAGNRVYTLDDRPALDVYLERLDAPADARSDPEAFTRFAITHPLGLDRRSSVDVRFVGEANFEDRSLGCIANVPENGIAWIMEGDDGTVMEATVAACRDALVPLQDRRPLALIAFDCIARRGVLGEDGIQREVDMICDQAGGAPVAGFYTYGEFARTHGMSGFHNQTLVVLALS